MKLSNKILLGFIASILLYTLLAAGEIRFRGDKYKKSNKGLLLESIKTNNYRYLVINDTNLKITIKRDDNSRMEVGGNQQSDTIKLNYKMLGDSLVIEKALTKYENGKWLDIFVGNKLINIVADGSDIRLEQFKNDSLKITQSGGRFVIMDETVINFLQLSGSNNSNTIIESDNVNNLNLNIEESRVNVNGITNELTATLTNNATLNARTPNKLTMEKEKNCKLIIIR